MNNNIDEWVVPDTLEKVYTFPKDITEEDALKKGSELLECDLADLECKTGTIAGNTLWPDKRYCVSYKGEKVWAVFRKGAW